MAVVKMMPLATPKVTYEVEVKGGKEVKVTPDGMILKEFKED